MIKGSIQEEEIILVYIYAPNTGALKCKKQTLTEIKGEADNNTIKIGEFSTPPSMDRSSRQKINKETVFVNDILEQLDLIDIYRTYHPNPTEYTLFLCAHGTFSRIDHMLGNKTNLSKLKKTKIIPNIFFQPNWHETRN